MVVPDCDIHNCRFGRCQRGLLGAQGLGVVRARGSSGDGAGLGTPCRPKGAGLGAGWWAGPTGLCRGAASYTEPFCVAGRRSREWAWRRGPDFHRWTASQAGTRRSIGRGRSGAAVRDGTACRAVIWRWASGDAGVASPEPLMKCGKNSRKLSCKLNL